MTGGSVRADVFLAVLDGAWRRVVRDARWQAAWDATDSGNYPVTTVFSALQTAPGMSGSSDG